MFSSFIVAGWLLSIFLFFYSISRYKYFSGFDFTLLLTWFPVFFRPFLTQRCDIADLYYNDDSLYIEGNIYSVLLLLLFQIGFIIPRKSVISGVRNRLASLKSRLSNKQIYTTVMSSHISFFSLFIVFSSFIIVGPSMAYRFTSQGGALSLNAGLLGSIFFGLLRYTSVCLALCNGYILAFTRQFRFFPLFSFIINLFALYLIGKRGALLAPMLSFVSIYSFISVFSFKELFSPVFKLIKSLKISYLSIILASLSFPFALFLISVIFRGFSIFENSNESFFCLLQAAGGQEYDQAWPGLLYLHSQKFHLLDLPFASIAQFIPHSIRVNLPEMFHSATDKFNLSFNYTLWTVDKFGISPDLRQFYFFYFGFISFALMPILGWFSRRLDFFFYDNCYFNIPKYFSLYTFLALPISVFDFSSKYAIIYSLLGFVLWVLFLSIVRLFSTSHVKSHC